MGRAKVSARFEIKAKAETFNRAKFFEFEISKQSAKILNLLKIVEE